jgi:hypothetical protein
MISGLASARYSSGFNVSLIAPFQPRFAGLKWRKRVQRAARCTLLRIRRIHVGLRALRLNQNPYFWGCDSAAPPKIGVLLQVLKGLVTSKTLLKAETPPAVRAD